MLRIGDFSRLARVTIKTLRYYDAVGLLKPAAIDRFTGYRGYTLDQLPRLNRILALKDLGLSLEQIAHLLDSDLDPGELRGMLRIRHGELQQEIEAAQARLARIETRIRQIELEDKMPDYEVMIKSIDPQQVISIRRILPTAEGIRPLIDDMKATLRQHNIRQSGAIIALYHHAGFRDHDLDVEVAVPVDSLPSGSITLPDGSQLVVRVIPAVSMALSVLLQGGYAELGSAYHALDTHLHQHGHNYLGPAREVYLHGPGERANPAEYLTEVQYPVGELSSETPVDGSELPVDWQGNTQEFVLSRRARTALGFAEREAAALHEAEVGPVHILLGLLRDGDSFAAHVLGDFDITLEQLRASAPRGQNPSSQSRISDSARQVVALAHDEAIQLGHQYIGTEHLLLGLLRQHHAALINLLDSAGVQPQPVRAKVLQTFG